MMNGQKNIKTCSK